MIKIGIVGAGGMAIERARAFAASGQAEIVGVVSRNTQRAEQTASAAGAKVFADFKQMLEQVDAVAICVPNSSHMQFALLAMQSNKHVLVEYPIATKWEDAVRLKNASLAYKAVLMVGNTIIHEAGFKYILSNKDRFGEIISASSRVAFYDLENSGKWYMDRVQLGPVFSSLHHHHIEFYKHFLGKAEWVLGRDESVIDPASGQYKSMVGGTLVLSYGARKTSCIQWYLGTGADGLSRCMCVNGTRSTLSLVSIENGKTHAVWSQGGDCEIINEEWGVTGSCDEFLKAIRGELDYRARLQSDLNTFQIGLAGCDSARSGGIVYLE